MRHKRDDFSKAHMPVYQPGPSLDVSGLKLVQTDNQYVHQPRPSRYVSDLNLGQTVNQYVHRPRPSRNVSDLNLGQTDNQNVHQPRPSRYVSDLKLGQTDNQYVHQPRPSRYVSDLNLGQTDNQYVYQPRSSRSVSDLTSQTDYQHVHQLGQAPQMKRYESVMISRESLPAIYQKAIKYQSAANLCLEAAMRLNAISFDSIDTSQESPRFVHPNTYESSIPRFEEPTQFLLPNKPVLLHNQAEEHFSSLLSKRVDSDWKSNGSCLHRYPGRSLMSGPREEIMNNQIGFPSQQFIYSRHDTCRDDSITTPNRFPLLNESCKARLSHISQSRYHPYSLPSTTQVLDPAWTGCFGKSMVEPPRLNVDFSERMKDGSLNPTNSQLPSGIHVFSHLTSSHTHGEVEPLFMDRGKVPTAMNTSPLHRPWLCVNNELLNDQTGQFDQKSQFPQVAVFSCNTSNSKPSQNSQKYQQPVSFKGMDATVQSSCDRLWQKPLIQQSRKVNDSGNSSNMAQVSRKPVWIESYQDSVHCNYINNMSDRLEETTRLPYMFVCDGSLPVSNIKLLNIEESVFPDSTSDAKNALEEKCLSESTHSKASLDDSRSEDVDQENIQNTSEILQEHQELQASGNLGAMKELGDCFVIRDVSPKREKILSLKNRISELSSQLPGIKRIREQDVLSVSDTLAMCQKQETVTSLSQTKDVKMTGFPNKQEMSPQKTFVCLKRKSQTLPKNRKSAMKFVKFPRLVVMLKKCDTEMLAKTGFVEVRDFKERTHKRLETLSDDEHNMETKSCEMEDFKCSNDIAEDTHKANTKDCEIKESKCVSKSVVDRHIAETEVHLMETLKCSNKIIEDTHKPVTQAQVMEGKECPVKSAEAIHAAKIEVYDIDKTPKTGENILSQLKTLKPVSKLCKKFKGVSYRLAKDLKIHKRKMALIGTKLCRKICNKVWQANKRHNIKCVKRRVIQKQSSSNNLRCNKKLGNNCQDSVNEKQVPEHVEVDSVFSEISFGKGIIVLSEYEKRSSSNSRVIRNAKETILSCTSPLSNMKPNQTNCMIKDTPGLKDDTTNSNCTMIDDTPNHDQVVDTTLLCCLENLADKGEEGTLKTVSTSSANIMKENVEGNTSLNDEETASPSHYETAADILNQIEKTTALIPCTARNEVNEAEVLQLSLPAVELSSSIVHFRISDSLEKALEEHTKYWKAKKSLCNVGNQGVDNSCVLPFYPSLVPLYAVENHIKSFCDPETQTEERDQMWLSKCQGISLKCGNNGTSTNDEVNVCESSTNGAFDSRTRKIVCKEDHERNRIEVLGLTVEEFEIFRSRHKQKEEEEKEALIKAVSKKIEKRFLQSKFQSRSFENIKHLMWSVDESVNKAASVMCKKLECDNDFLSDPVADIVQETFEGSDVEIPLTVDDVLIPLLENTAETAADVWSKEDENNNTLDKDGMIPGNSEGIMVPDSFDDMIRGMISAEVKCDRASKSFGYNTGLTSTEQYTPSATSTLEFSSSLASTLTQPTATSTFKSARTRVNMRQGKRRYEKKFPQAIPKAKPKHAPSEKDLYESAKKFIGDLDVTNKKRSCRKGFFSGCLERRKKCVTSETKKIVRPSVPSRKCAPEKPEKSYDYILKRNIGALLDKKVEGTGEICQGNPQGNQTYKEMDTGEGRPEKNTEQISVKEYHVGKVTFIETPKSHNQAEKLREKNSQKSCNNGDNTNELQKSSSPNSSKELVDNSYMKQKTGKTDLEKKKDNSMKKNSSKMDKLALMGLKPDLKPEENRKTITKPDKTVCLKNAPISPKKLKAKLLKTRPKSDNLKPNSSTKHGMRTTKNKSCPQKVMKMSTTKCWSKKKKTEGRLPVDDLQDLLRMKVYVCHVCKNSFDKESKMKHHYRKAHSKWCLQCHKCFPSEEEKQRHVRRNHDITMFCGVCNRTYELVKSYVLHLNSAKHKDNISRMEESRPGFREVGDVETISIHSHSETESSIVQGFGSPKFDSDCEILSGHSANEDPSNPSKQSPKESLRLKKAGLSSPEIVDQNRNLANSSRKDVGMPPMQKQAVDACEMDKMTKCDSHKGKWCDLCDKVVLWYQKHLKTKTHKMNCEDQLATKNTKEKQEDLLSPGSDGHAGKLVHNCCDKKDVQQASKTVPLKVTTPDQHCQYTSKENTDKSMQTHRYEKRSVSKNSSRPKGTCGSNNSNSPKDTVVTQNTTKSEKLGDPNGLRKSCRYKNCYTSKDSAAVKKFYGSQMYGNQKISSEPMCNLQAESAIEESGNSLIVAVNQKTVEPATASGSNDNVVKIQENDMIVNEEDEADIMMLHIVGASHGVAGVNDGKSKAMEDAGMDEVGLIEECDVDFESDDEPLLVINDVRSLNDNPDAMESLEGVKNAL